MKCLYCGGSGTISVIKNNAEFYFNGDEPIIEDEPCDECGGSGMAESPIIPSGKE